jgi:large subunit ribosomal protein L28
MARVCAVCDKGPQVGFSVSHAKNRVKRWLYPNVHRMRFTLADDQKGKVHQAKVCTRCLKAGKIKKIV